MNNPVIVVGAGGHGKVIVDALLASGRPVIGLTDPRAELHGSAVLGLPVIGGDEALAGYGQGTVELAMGLGAVHVSPERYQLFMRMKARGYTFTKVIHPSATVGREVELGEGCQIMAGAVIQAGARLGIGALINTCATVDHDCRIGDHAHVGPRAVLCGDVHLGAGTVVGAGATVIQGIRIGDAVQVGAAAAVLQNFADGSTVVGIPARAIPK